MALNGAISAALLPSLCTQASAVSAPAGGGAAVPVATLSLRVAEAAAAAWAAASGAMGSADPPPVQAASTFMLLLLLAAVGNPGIDRSGSLLRSILQVTPPPLFPSAMAFRSCLVTPWAIPSPCVLPGACPAGVRRPLLLLQPLQWQFTRPLAHQ